MRGLREAGERRADILHVTDRDRALGTGTQHRKGHCDPVISPAIDLAASHRASPDAKAIGKPFHVDADRLVHVLMEPGTPENDRIVARFGPEVRAADGRIDRPRLGAIVFADPAALRELEAILHPGVRAELRRRLAASTAPIFVVDAIKLIEGDRHFQKGRARMRLRLHNDASQLFAVYRQPTKAYKYCQGEMAGLAIEAVSFRDNGNYGFAARWADADRGEWLAAVVTAPTIHEATALRRSLFTLTFPGMKR